ncbi:MAG: DUF262 domain-containing protein [Bifidobacterium crudilactis]|jgi:hypothetical protein
MTENMPSRIKYDMTPLTISDLAQITIPTFQRRFVWTMAKKKKLIQTLHQGLPFGTILLYPRKDQNTGKTVRTLLDGQQRLSTINEYNKNKLKFWKPLNLEEYGRNYKQFNDLVPENHTIPESTFDELVQTDELQRLAGIEEALGENSTKDDRHNATTILVDLRKKLNDFIDLEHTQIFAISFTGEENEIPEVYMNLNEGGTPLNKYEIFRATWTNTEIKLKKSANEEKILNLVKRYYQDAINKGSFDIDNYSEDEMSDKRTVTLAEFGLALGEFTANLLPSLITEGSAAEIGFGLLGIATNIDNRNLDKLDGKLSWIQTHVPDLLTQINEIATSLQQTFRPLLHKISAKDGEFESGISTTFKTLSFFAALWGEKADSVEFKQTLKNIPPYYVYDALSGIWGSHGDQRVFEYYPESKKRNYLKNLTPQEFSPIIDQWIADRTAGINFNRETKALTTIHSNLSYLAIERYKGEPFELEHIVARKLINASDDGRQKIVLGNSLGNCMYLPKNQNNSKKQKTCMRSLTPRNTIN